MEPLLTLDPWLAELTSECQHWGEKMLVVERQGLHKMQGVQLNPLSKRFVGS